MQDNQLKKREINLRTGRRVEPNPLISIVIPAYNTAEYIAETLDSVFAQSFSDYEVIVVNDGSPDTERLEEVLDKYSEQIIYIVQTNGGAGVARNTAIGHSRSSNIAFLDGDDVWFSNFLASQYGFLEAGGFDMVYCDAELFGMPMDRRKTYMETAPSNGSADFDSILDLRCNVITSGTLVRKAAVARAGMFETRRVQSEDFHLWLRIAKTGAKIGYQRQALLKYRVRLDSLSGDSISRVRRGIDVFKRVGKTIDLSAEQRMRVEKRLLDFTADLAVEQGKMYLLDGRFTEAAAAIDSANRQRHSLKLTLISLLIRFAPKMLVKIYRSKRPNDIAFVPDSENSS